MLSKDKHFNLNNVHLIFNTFSAWLVWTVGSQKKTHVFLLKYCKSDAAVQWIHPSMYVCFYDQEPPEHNKKSEPKYYTETERNSGLFLCKWSSSFICMSFLCPLFHPSFLLTPLKIRTAFQVLLYFICHLILLSRLPLCPCVHLYPAV